MRLSLILVALLSGCTLFERDPVIRSASDMSGDVSSDTQSLNDVSTDPSNAEDMSKVDTSDTNTPDISEDLSVPDDMMAVTPEDWSPGFQFVLSYDSVDVLENTGSGPNDMVNDLAFPITGSPGVFGRAGEMNRATGFVRSDAGDFNTIDTGLTVGTWMRVSSADINSPDVISVHDATSISGASLSLYSDGRVVCWGADGVSAGALETDDAWVRDEWVHLACSYDQVMGRTIMFVNGTTAEVVNNGTIIGDANIRFTLGNYPGDGGFEGRLDETFVARRPMSSLEIKRIAQCGIEGLNCTCDPNDKAAYIDCGGEDCSAMPPCSAPFLP